MNQFGVLVFTILTLTYITKAKTYAERNSAAHESSNELARLLLLYASSRTRELQRANHEDHPEQHGIQDYASCSEDRVR